MLSYNATNNYGVKYWKFSVFVANGDAVDRKLIEDDIILQDYINVTKREEEGGGRGRSIM